MGADDELRVVKNVIEKFINGPIGRIFVVGLMSAQPAEFIHDMGRDFSEVSLLGVAHGGVVNVNVCAVGECGCSFISGFLGRKIGVTGAHIITCTCLIISSILATVAFYEVGICGSPVSIYLSSWVDSELMSISWEFLFDQLTVSMLIPVLYISSVIHIFSISYMENDPHVQRFFSYLSLFTFFMLLLVSGANYFVMFVGLFSWPKVLY